MKTKQLGIMSLCLLSSSAMAASQLEIDLRTPSGPMNNPFTQMSEVALPSKALTALKSLLQSCLYRPVNGNFYDEAHVRETCSSSIQTKVESYTPSGLPVLSPKVEIHAGGLHLIAVTWDGDNSDHGDEMALGIYKPNGDRVAIYKSLYLDGNTLDALTAIVGIAAEVPTN